MRLIGSNIIVTVIIALVVSSTGFTGGTAFGMIDADAYRNEAPVLGHKISIDAGFAETHQVSIQAPFEFYVPNRKGVEVFAAFPPETGEELVNLSFATADKKLIENLRLVGMTVPLSSEEERLDMVAKLLEEDVLPKLMNDLANPRFLGLRRTTLKGLEVVEAAARFDHPTRGPMYLWLVGILNPRGENSVLALSQIVPNLSEVHCYDDLGRKGMAAQALGTFKFLSN